MPLPSDFTVRAPTMDDAQAVTDLVIANDIAETGAPDYSLGDLLSEWRRPGFDLATDAWLVIAPDGSLAGYGDVWDSGGRARLSVTSGAHPAYRDRGIEEYVLDRAEAWTRERAKRGGSRVIQHVVNSRVEDKVARLVARGYAPVRHDWVMEITLDAPPPAPRIPEGITFRSFRPGLDDRVAFETIEEAFEDHWGHTRGTLEQWKVFISEREYFSPELSLIAWEGDPESGSSAGAIMSFDYPEGGWIRQLGVRRAWRKRGLGLALLQQVFGAFYARGVRKIGLGVDSESLTGATRLYERAGMHVAQRFTRYEKTIEV